MRKEGFILTRHAEATAAGQNLVLWLKTATGPFKLEIPNESSVCFVLQQDCSAIEKLLTGSGIDWTLKKLNLKNFAQKPMAGLYCTQQTGLYQATRILKRYGISVWEDDIVPTERYLMERQVRAGLEWIDHSNRVAIRPVTLQPGLSRLAIRVEARGWRTTQIPQLLAIVASGDASGDASQWCGYVASETTPTTANAQPFDDAASLLRAFLQHVVEQDPDVILGWRLVQDDLRLLQHCCDAVGLRLMLGRDQTPVVWHRSDPNKDHWRANTQGRVFLDGIDTLKTAFYFFQDDSLESVASAVLRDEETDAVASATAESADLMQQAKNILAIFHQLQLVPFLIARSYLTGLTLDRSGGSAAAFNNLYLPRLHRHGYVAPSVGSQTLHFQSPGGYVFDSVPGLFDNVLVLDFKSLYPSIIRTYLIDPLGMILALSGQSTNPLLGFDGGSFDRDCHILPGLIAELWTQRDQAKAAGDQSLSQAIKILMNSFYGVLGSDICRFYDPRLASSITRRGHEILKASRQWIEDQGYQVIYGDTDSVFVHVGATQGQTTPQQIGAELAKGLNLWWQERVQLEAQKESSLEIEFETSFDRFLMPRLRSQEAGSKKRYAGVQRHADGTDTWVFKGLEAVRSDWTPLAKDFQRQLYQLVFQDQPFDVWIRQFVDSVLAGTRDADLVFDRPVKRQVDDYAGGLPPVAQALKQLQQQYPGKVFRRVQYVMTLNGVEALTLQRSPLDYDFYITRQLAPIADAVLCFKAARFDQIVTAQIGLL